MSTIRKYILIDDDELNNLLCSMAIEEALGEAIDIKLFTVPEKGLEFIQNEYVNTLEPTILFLDINMPSMTGWEFMEEYENLSELVKSQICVYILSSSVDHRDIDMAEANKNVKGFLSKPLEQDTILNVAKA